MAEQGKKRIERRREPIVQHHPRSTTASPERFKQLAGVIPLKGPAPFGKFIDEAC